MAGTSGVDTSLTSAALIRLLIGPNTTGDDDARLTSIAERASAQVSTIVGRRLELALHTEYLSGHGGPLRLRNWPVLIAGAADPWASSVGIWESRDRTWGAASKLTEGRHYYIEPGEEGRGVVHRLDNAWRTEPGAIRTIYQGGYASNDMPKPLVDAATRIARIMYDRVRVGADALNSMSVQQGGGSLSFSQKDIPEEVMALLRRYRRPSL